MKQTRITMSLIALAMAILPLAIAPHASADSNPIGSPQGNPQVTPSIDPYKVLMDQFKIDRDNFVNVMKQRGIQIRTINTNFKLAIDNAASNYLKEIVAAKTPDQKNLAVANRKNSISAAIVARDLAIASLGAEPTPPVEPAKPTKAPKNKVR